MQVVAASLRTKMPKPVSPVSISVTFATLTRSPSGTE